MKKIEIQKGIVSSNIENIDYFALRVVYGDFSIEDSRFIGFYHDDSGLLEFTVSKATSTIKRVQLVACNNYEIVDENLPRQEVTNEGTIKLRLPQHNDVDEFLLSVYNDGVHISLSNESASEVFKCGQIAYGLSSTGELVSITVYDMNEYDINHTIEELNFDSLR